mgnify:CR=1 FL=1
MMKEQAVEINMDENELNYLPLVAKRKEQKRMRKIVFREVIKLINDHRTYMLGNEKSKAAWFVSNHFEELHHLLENLMKTERMEGKRNV